jgi:trehalose 6-phosphate synthase/phosphatase
MYYNGFCNSVLWQLFHYVPLNIDNWQKMSEQRAMQMQWQAYQVGVGRGKHYITQRAVHMMHMWGCVWGVSGGRMQRKISLGTA